MRKAFIWLPVCALLIGGIGCSHLMHKNGGKEEEENEGNEQKISMAQVPAAVQATLQREAGGAAITTVDKESKDGKTVYEADAPINGKNYEIVVAEDGTLLKKKLDDESKEKGEKKGESEEEEKNEKNEKNEK